MRHVCTLVMKSITHHVFLRISVLLIMKVSKYQRAIVLFVKLRPSRAEKPSLLSARRAIEVKLLVAIAAWW